MGAENQASAKATLLDYVFVLALALIWGWAFLAAKIALIDFGPLTLTAGRILIGAVLLLIVAFYMRIPLIPEPGKWPYFFAMGLVMNALPFALLNWGQLGVASAFAGVSMAIIPLIVLILSVIFLKASVRFGQVLGVGIGLVGVVFLLGIGDIFSGFESGALLPKLACLGAALCYSVGGIILRFGRDINPLQLSALGLSIGAVFMIALALAVEGVPSVSKIGAPFFALVYLGVGPTALATILLVRVINSAGPGFLSLVNYQVPIWSVLAGVFVLGEQLPPNFFAALGLILLGLFASQFFAKKH